MPGWKSLLDIDRLLEAWRSPDTAAPQRMTLLRHVADLAAAIDPADREGDGNAIPVVVPGPEKKTRAIPATWVGQKKEGGDGREAGSAEIPPPPDYGARDVTVDEIRGLLKSDGRNRQWDNATLRAWAELARQDPEKAKAMLDEVRDAPVRTPDGGVSVPLPPRDGRAPGASPEAIAEIGESLMTGKDWAAEARRIDAPVIVDLPKVRQGYVFRQRPIAEDTSGLTPDTALASLRRLVAKEKKTEEEYAKAESLARWMEGMPAAERRKLPLELRTYFENAHKSLGGKFTAAMPNTGDMNKTGVRGSDWNRWTKEATDAGLGHALGTVAGRAFLKGGADTLADLADGANIVLDSEDVKALTERFRKEVETHLGRLDEYKDLKSLDRAEYIGGEIAQWALTGAVGKAVKGVGWLGRLASEKTAAALKKLPADQREAARKAAEAIIEKLKGTSLVEKLSQSPAVKKVAEGVRKAADAAPEVAKTGTGAMIAGGEVAHDLGKKGVRDDRAAVGGFVAGGADIGASAAAKRLTKGLLPEGLHGTWVSDVVEEVASGTMSSAASEAIKRGVTALDRWRRGRPRSTLGPVEELRRLMRDG